MQRGTLISAKPASRVPNVVTASGRPTIVPGVILDRILDTAEANEFLGKKKGFLEKRRISGIDSPRYIQRKPRCAVTYRVSDLIAWEDEQLRTCSSDHGHASGANRNLG